MPSPCHCDRDLATRTRFVPAFDGTDKVSIEIDFQQLFYFPGDCLVWRTLCVLQRAGNLCDRRIIEKPYAGKCIIVNWRERTTSTQ